MTNAPTIAIENHGVIGDLRTAALVARDGAISFLCAPDFDSPSIFAYLLDETAGHFRIAPQGDGLRTTQMYLPDTNVLLTRFMSAKGIAELTDLMPVDTGDGIQAIQRSIRVIRGHFALEAVLRAPVRLRSPRPHHRERRSFPPKRRRPRVAPERHRAFERRGWSAARPLRPEGRRERMLPARDRSARPRALQPRDRHRHIPHDGGMVAQLGLQVPL